MDEHSKNVLIIAGFIFDTLDDLNGYIIQREILLSDNKYEEIQKLIPELKTKYSSSVMTSLHKNAQKIQQWPLINIVRQILHRYNYKMNPIRKSDGYTIDGVKKYKRFFVLERNTNNTIKNEDVNVIID
jgi:hypothetical protein